MKNPFSKLPFLFLLIPLIIGILLQYYFKPHNISILFFLLGIIAMLCSYLIPEKRQFSWRWLFGGGASLFMIGVGIVSTTFRQDISQYTFPDEVRTYRGIVADTPQEKPRTTAYKVYLPDEDKRVVCYFQKDSLLHSRLQPGYEFLFRAQIQPFKNMGNPDDFDYVGYMYNQGFAGSAYIPVHSWRETGIVIPSLKYKALRCRQQILEFYQSLGFDEVEYSILAALTLGYQAALTDDLKQSFRTTGTVHVLSVSGLHVGIIYLMISFLLGFIRRGSKYYWIKPILIILLLWIYAFVTGLPSSVVRASLMLTVFCVSEVFGRKSFSLHALFITAFFMLLYNPFSLFEIGFQLSFLSVLSILLLQPKASGLLRVENKYLRGIWQMFTLSIVAQLATFPICLYYFGTFPTYFFIANLFIVPLVSLITYAVGGIVIAKLVSFLLPDLSFYIYFLPVKVLQLLVHIMTSVINFIESFPFALIDNVKISFADLILIFAVIVSGILFLYYKKAKILIIALFAILMLIVANIVDNLKTQNDNLIVYNRRQSTEIRWRENGSENIVRGENLIGGYKLIEINKNTTLTLSQNIWNNKDSQLKFKVKNLILTNDNTFSLYSLTQLIAAENIVLDASLSAYARRRLAKECQKLNIPCHDVVLNGAFSLNF